MRSTTRIRRWWTEEEDDILRREAEFQLREGALKDWNRIAAKLPGRTNKDCRKRWSKVSEHVNKGVWSAAEDQRLRGAVERYGYQWTHVAQSVGTRHADQCAKRWQHYLDPSIDHSEWHAKDDERLIAAVEIYGRNWKLIGEKMFPGRSTTDIKNRHVIVDRRRRQTHDSSESSPNADVAASATSQPGQNFDSDSDSDDFGSADDAYGGSGDMDLSFETAANSSSNTSPPVIVPANPDAAMETEQTIALPPLHDIEDHGDIFSGGPDPFLGEPTTTPFYWDDSSLIMDPDWTPAPGLPPNVEQSLPPAPASTPTSMERSSMQHGSAPFRTTLILEDVQADTLNNIINTLYKSRTNVKMRLLSTPEP